VDLCGGGSPALSLEDVCRTCMEKQRQQSMREEQSSGRILDVLRQVEEDEQNPEACRDGFLVSKTWLA